MNKQTDTDLSGLLTVIGNWKKPIILFVIIATVIAAVTSFFVLPKQYYSGTTLLPVNSMLTDKARVFNNNIQELYSVYGTSDDLDRIYTIAKAGNVFGFVVDSLKLIQHFNINKDEKARTKAVEKLKKAVSITKTENGALQIDVWDTDAVTAANIANLIVFKTETLGNELLLQADQHIIDRLAEDIIAKNKTYTLLLDSIRRTGGITNAPLTANAAQLLELIQRDEKIKDEFTLAANIKQPSLMVLEKAYPSLKTDKPKHVFIILTALLLSLFFAILAAVIINRVKA